MSTIVDLDLLRYLHGPNHTIGLLLLQRAFFCYSLEDQFRRTKVAGETRIPPGRYRIVLRTDDTPTNRRYAERFDDEHHGMLWLQGVPGFEYVYIHIGNTDEDTEGCILVGDQAYPDRLGLSTPAYLRLYRKLATKIMAGDEVYLNLHDTFLPEHMAA